MSLTSYQIDALHLLGYTYLEQRKYNIAEVLYRRLYREQPDNIQFVIGFAFILLLDDNMEKTKKALNILEPYSKSYESMLHFLLAKAYGRMGISDETEKSIKRFRILRQMQNT